MTDAYPRDLRGYGQNPPDPKWPGGARLAVQIVINYEEGGESSILHGDAASEAYLSELVGIQPIQGQRNFAVESLYDYGSRAGFWRLHRLFTERGVPVTVYGVAMAMERNPEAVTAMAEADWEIASHGYRWIDYQYVSEEVERDHMKRAIEIQTRLTGQRPLGWYIGRFGPNTRKLVVEDGGFLYHADAYDDDLPHWNTECGKPLLIVPYTLDVNDMRFGMAQGFNTADHFFTYARDAFDALYAEGATAPKMMSIGLHCRLIGRPGRISGLARLLDHIQAHDDVWVCRRVDIARHWIEHHPYNPPAGA